MVPKNRYGYEVTNIPHNKQSKYVCIPVLDIFRIATSAYHIVGKPMQISHHPALNCSLATFWINNI